MIEDLWTRSNQELEAWRSAPLADLVAHIVEHYHLPARVEMGRLETYAEAAVLLEGGDDAELLEIRDETARFCREFRTHMTMEERSLFPAILDRDQAPAGQVELIHPLKKLLEDEHKAEMDLFQRLRDLTTELAVPSGDRGPRAKLRETLATLEKSMFSHIFLENHVLYRRVG